MEKTAKTYFSPSHTLLPFLSSLSSSLPYLPPPSFIPFHPCPSLKCSTLPLPFPLQTPFPPHIQQHFPPSHSLLPTSLPFILPLPYLHTPPPATPPPFTHTTAHTYHRSSPPLPRYPFLPPLLHPHLTPTCPTTPNITINITPGVHLSLPPSSPPSSSSFPNPLLKTLTNNNIKGHY